MNPVPKPVYVVDNFIKDVLPWLEKLRAVGVLRFKLDDFEVDLHPAVAAREPGSSVPDDFAMGAPEKCRCGHEETEHAGQGYCLRGCDTAACKEPEKAA